jgi:two-component system, chemotaxis family, sensor kinase CheA
MDDASLFDVLRADFLLESERRLDAVEQALLALGESPSANDPEALDGIRRELHTLKGNAAMMGFKALQERVHGVEEIVGSAGVLTPERTNQLLLAVDELRALLHATTPPADGEETGDTAGGDEEKDSGGLLIASASVDALVELLSDSMILGSRLAGLIESAPAQGDLGEQMMFAWQALEKSFAAIHRRALAMRLVPLKSLFASLHRVVHDESSTARKEVRFTSTGGDTPLDKALMDVASDALGHIVRNAVIHGIESPETRRLRGKQPAGEIRVSAVRSGAEEVCITVEDDGGGIDRERLLAAARNKGLAVESAIDLESLLFLPGLSTLEEATLSAGRGMGLSASVAAVRRVGGRIEVDARLGEGTMFRLYLPLQVSMLRVMLVEADDERYALPLSSVASVARMRAGEVHFINGSGTMSRRRGLLPLLDLGLTFGTAASVRPAGTVVTLGVGGKRRGLLVDRPGAVLDCVIKPLDPICGSVGGVLGTTILSDGRVLLALDPAGMIERPLAAGGGA